MHDIIVVGAGPAGMTAALYALRANKKVLVIEAKVPGGQIVNASLVENYPGIQSISGAQYSIDLYNQIKNLGCDFAFETVIRITNDLKVITSKNEYSAKAIILATGAQNRKLNIENEDKYIGKGVSYCATCDGAFYKDKVTMVVGGGNTALEDAVYLSNLAKKVYLVHRRDSFRGENKYLEELRSKENIEFIMNSKVSKINGDERLKSVEVEDLNNETKAIEIDGLFIAVGQEPKNQIFEDIIELDDKGYIKTADGVHTNIEKIYVAGDTKNKELKQLVTAVSDGAIAANVAIKEMEE